MIKGNERGVALIIAVLTLGILLLLGIYFVRFTLTEFRISKSQKVASQAYYLAEAGINQAIWKLKYDEYGTITDGDLPWATCFVSSTDPCPPCNTTWTASFIQNTDSLIPNSTIAFSIERTPCGEGRITATSTIDLGGGRTAQRVVKTKVHKATASLTADSPVFAGSPSGETKIDDSTMNIYNGNMFINNNLRIKTGGRVNVYDNQTTTEQEGKVLVVGNCILSGDLNSSSTCCANQCNTTSTCECEPDPEDFFERCEATPAPGRCPPNLIGMPAIDFGSDHPNSYKSKAIAAQQEDPPQCSVLGKRFVGATTTLSTNCLFTEKEFKDLLDWVGWGGTLTLEHRANGSAISTYYVKGGITVGRGRHLEVNGVLVAEKTVNIGEWSNGYLVIKDPGLGIPSGLLTPGKMNFGGWFFFWGPTTEVTGLLYSQGEFDIDSLAHTFNVTGGIIGRKFDLDDGWGNHLNIYLDDDIIREGIWGGPKPPGEEKPPFSPIVTVEHWEESY